MMMRGRGKGATTEKPEADETAEAAATTDLAADMADKALAAEKAAQLAEEVARRAKEAARLAKEAADAAEALQDAEVLLAAEAKTDSAVETEADPAEADLAEDEPVEGSTDAEADEDAEDSTDVEAPTDVEDEEGAEDEAEDDEDELSGRRRLFALRRARKAAQADLAGEDDPDGDEVASGPSRLVRWSVPLIAVLTVVAVGLTVAVVMFSRRSSDLDTTSRASRQALLAASRVAQDISSYDYRSLDADFKTAADQTTGELRKQYDQLTVQVRASAVQQQAVSQATVLKAGVVSAKHGEVVVLVYANRTSVTAAQKDKQLPESLRIKITMVKVKDRWLASALTVLS